MKRFLLFTFAVLSASTLFAQPEIDDHCVKKSVPFRKLKKMLPFSDAVKVKVVSFKPKLGQKGEYVFEIPKTNNQIDTTQFHESHTLNLLEEQELLDILMNYNYSQKAEAISSTRSTCDYFPRNAILFCDTKGNIIAYIEICFQCSIYELYPERHTFPKSLRVGEFCGNKWNMVKELFFKSGLKFGVIEIENR